MSATSKLIHAVAFQVGWFICILGGNWFSLTYTIIFLAAHFWFLSHKKTCLKKEALWLLLVFVSGFILETISFSNKFLYSLTPTVIYKYLIIAPLWMLNLWILFALALRTFLSFIFIKPNITYLITCVAIPLNYYAGAELSTNVSINNPHALSLALITLMWIALLWFLIKLKSGYFEDIFDAR